MLRANYATELHESNEIFGLDVNVSAGAFALVGTELAIADHLLDTGNRKTNFLRSTLRGHIQRLVRHVDSNLYAVDVNLCLRFGAIH